MLRKLHTPQAAAAVAAAFAVAWAAPAAAQNEGPEALQFFAQEAQVVSASMLPESVREAPATVYVVTAEDIKASGAQTIPDALRAVPGVDVIESRAFQQDVSIRGLDRPLSRRTLVLLDGKPVQNLFFDFPIWEQIPVTMDEIERIEVVEGPASALYGEGAINGVINIITKTPEQLRGGRLTYTGGENDTQLTSVLYGNRAGAWDYKASAAWRQTYGFQDPDRSASVATKGHASLGYEPDSETRLGLTGGFSQIHTDVSAGQAGVFTADGPTGFLQGDLSRGNTSLRFYWDRSRVTDLSLPSLNSPQMDYDDYDAKLQHSVDLPGRNTLSVGGSYRKTTVTSNIFAPGVQVQDQWAAFFEDRWKPFRHWTVYLGARADKPQYTDWVLSPRGSILFQPDARQVLRFSAGSSFRTPALLENYVNWTQTFPNPGQFPPSFTSIASTLLGSTALLPERMVMFELSHSAKFGPFETNVAGFQYRLTQVVINANPQVTGLTPPTADVLSTFENLDGVTAWGGEAGLQYAASPDCTAFANDSYQSLKDDSALAATAPISPRSPQNKVNAGVKLRRGGWDASLWGDWVDETSWTASPIGGTLVSVEVPPYAILNGRVGYLFSSGRWKGLELSINAFNITNNRHYELLPIQNAAEPGQGGEIVGSRWTGTVSYRF